MQSRLYDLRKHVKGMTQQQMADYLNISTKAYRDKENGKNQFTQDEMFAISELFNLNIDTIFLPRKFQIGTNTSSLTGVDWYTKIIRAGIPL